MTPIPKAPDTSSREFVKQSSLYQEFLAEREEILKHKWLESERLGYDIGFERALLDWIRKHREGWRAARRQQLAAQQAGNATAAKQRASGRNAPYLISLCSVWRRRWGLYFFFSMRSVTVFLLRVVR